MEVWGDMGRCGKVWGYAERFGEMRGDTGRYGEMRGGTGRYGEMRVPYLPQAVTTLKRVKELCEEQPPRPLLATYTEEPDPLPMRTTGHE